MNPTAPTRPLGDNSNAVATTAFVQGSIVATPIILPATTFVSNALNPAANALTALTTSGTFGGGLKLSDTNFIGFWSTVAGAQLNIGLGGTATGWTAANTFTFSSTGFNIPSTMSLGLTAGSAFLERAGLILQARTAGATIGTIADTATVAKIYDGSAAAPHSANTPSISFYRNDGQNSAVLTGNAPTLWVENSANNTGAGNPNANALIAVATQTGNGDVVGVVGSAVQQLSAGPGYYAFGGNFDAESFAVNGRAFGLELFTANRTGTDQPYSGPIPRFTGIHIAAGGTNLNTAAVWINSLTVPTSWDIGIAFTENSIKTAAIQDDSNSPTILKATSTHTNGIDLSGATIATSAFKSTGFNVTGAGVITGIGTNLTGTASGLTAGNVTTNANLTGPVTSVGNATTIGANQVTRAMEAQGVARSVIGVTGNATANVADIQGTANQALVVNSAGTALAFGAVNLASASAVTGVLPAANMTLTPPTRQIFKSGTAATYTRPTSPTPIQIRIRMVGGGGGGGGSGTGVSGGTGGDGTDTTFSTFTANKGTGGVGGATPGNGGAAVATSGATWGLAGSIGGGAQQGIVGTILQGGAGGSSTFFGSTAPGAASTANSGSGGGGGPAIGAVVTGAGGGGGAGLETVINTPATTYTYTVGAAGTAGAAGTSGNAGSAGAAGIIIVDEIYQ